MHTRHQESEAIYTLEKSPMQQFHSFSKRVFALSKAAGKMLGKGSRPGDRDRESLAG
jgi:hypothetical protein